MSPTQQLLSDRDRQLVESLAYDPSLEPRFNALRSYLTWEDESPSGITPNGYDTLSDLLIARAFLYHGFELPELCDRRHFADIWNRAIAEKLKWPGFNRLVLSATDREYYDRVLNEEDPFD